jgi:hypothetical protein
MDYFIFSDTKQIFLYEWEILKVISKKSGPDQLALNMAFIEKIFHFGNRIEKFEHFDIVADWVFKNRTFWNWVYKIRTNEVEIKSTKFDWTNWKLNWRNLNKGAIRFLLSIILIKLEQSTKFDWTNNSSSSDTINI